MLTTAQFRLLALLSAMFLSGCDFIDTVETLAPCSKGTCRPPAVNIAEIESLGVTLSETSRPLPETLDTDLFTRESDGETFIFSNGLDFYFSPESGFEQVENPDSIANDWADHPYAYTFSEEVGMEYLPIKPIIPFNAFLFEDTPFGPLRVTDQPEELITFGNHILLAGAEIPVRATHVELWFRTERNQEFELLRRVALSSLIVWRQYLEPALPANM
jgi:hypothetical protein